MPIATQDSRHIAIETPLGTDVLLLESFSGHEEISRLFEFDLQLLSEDYNINSDDIIGQNVTIRMDLSGGGTRYWNGHIVRFTKSASSSQRFAQYRATMVPWLWFLTRTSDCRIFQEKTVPDIVKQVCSDLGFTDVEERLSGSYGTWTYCVQYRETDFNFISRLMEQEGIYYYFLHEDGKCTIVLSDSRSMHDSYGDYDEIGFDSRASSDQERIREWTVEKQLQAGKVSHTDYNFKKPATSLMSLESESWGYTKGEFEKYDFPGEFLEKPDGEQYAKVRMEELVRSYEECIGEADSRGICPGYLFTLTVRDSSDLSMSDQTREYLVVSADYQATSEAYETSGDEAAGGADDSYGCFFTVIPSSVQFRPARTTPKPVVEGSQTAVVTGPAGEEIYTDEYGRIKVQFHWDREGKRDENSSCWIRVSQGWAGDAWGSMHIPRIGQEVIVSFIEGDPDRPVITGRLYNADKVPPYELPDKKNISTIKSKSTPQDSGYNELRFDDTAGGEQIFLHAQGSRDTIVNGSWRETVGGEKHETVKSRKIEKIEGTMDQQVDGYYNAYITGLYQIRAEEDISLLGHGNMELFCTGSMYLGAQTDVVINATNGICIYHDSSNFITIDGSGVTIKGSMVNINSGGSIIPYAPLTVYGEVDPTEASSGRPPQEPSSDEAPTVPPVSAPSQPPGSTSVSSAATSAPSSSQTGGGGTSSQTESGAGDSSQSGDQQATESDPSPSQGQDSQSTQAPSSPGSGEETPRGTSTGTGSPSGGHESRHTSSQSPTDSGGMAQRGISTGTDAPPQGQDPQSAQSPSSPGSEGEVQRGTSTEGHESNHTSSQSPTDSGGTAQRGISAEPGPGGAGSGVE